MRRSRLGKPEIGQEIDRNKKIVNPYVLDYSALMYRTINVAILKDPYCDNNYAVWKSMMLLGTNGKNDGIFGFLQKFTPDRFIMAIDAKYVWRHDVFPEYKGHRKAVKKASKVDFDEFYPIAKEFLEDLKRTFKQFVFLDIPKCEADDIVAVLAKEIFHDEKMNIIASDGDFLQLQPLNNIFQYCPLKRKYITSINPELELQLKYIAGDRKDNIMAIKKYIRAKSVLEKGLDTFMEANPDLHEKYKINKTLLDFNCIPAYIKESIISTYKNYKTELNEDTFNFFIRNKISGVAGDYALAKNAFKNLS